MKKYSEAESFEVLRGHDAVILNEHMERLGKTRLSDFTEKQLDALREDLDAAHDEVDDDDDQG